MTRAQIKKQCVRIMAQATVAYLTTVDARLGPQTRAMLNLRNKRTFPALVRHYRGRDAFTVYFTTNRSSQKIKQIVRNGQACACFCLPDEWNGFMAGGKIEVVDDEKLKRAFWQEGWERYYHKGVDDPDYVVLRLRPAYLKGWLSPELFEFDL